MAVNSVNGVNCNFTGKTRKDKAPKKPAYTEAGNPYKKCNTGKKILGGGALAVATASTVIGGKMMGFKNLFRAMGPLGIAMTAVGIAAYYGIGAGIDAIVNNSRRKDADIKALNEKVDKLA